MASDGIEFVPLDGREVDASLLENMGGKSYGVSKPLLSKPPGATSGSSTNQRNRPHQPWKRFQPTDVWEWQVPDRLCSETTNCMQKSGQGLTLKLPSQDKREFWDSLAQASSASDGKQSASRRFRDAAWTQLKMVRSVVRKFPSVVVIPLLFCGLLIGLGIYGVRTAADSAEESAKHDAEAAALKVGGSFSLSLDRAIQPVITLGTFIQQDPAMERLGPLFYRIAPQLLQQVGSDTGALQLQLVPFGVVEAISPQQVDLEANGTNLFTDPTRRDEALRTVEHKGVWLAGPLSVSPNHTRVLIARNPVFLSPVAANTTWGNANTTTATSDCAACYDEATQTKFWGFAAVYIDWEKLTRGSGSGSGSALALLRSRDYQYSMTKQGAPGDPPTVLAATSPPAPSGGASVRVAVEVPGDTWQLDVAPQGGFRPSWEGPLIAVVAVVSLALAAVLFIAMLHHRRLIVLLRARLPGKALTTLRLGQPFYDHFPTCTALECNVVRYTNLQSGVNPLEVVRLLNDVYGILDGLVEEHGLHKVETFGDSYVAVGGCPEAGGRDAITWAALVAHCARDMVVAAAKYRSAYGQRVQIQIGLHSGPLVAAVIDGGKRLPRYCLLGDTLAVAGELCTSSQPMAIHVSRATAELLAESGDPMIMLVPRGLTPIMGRGIMFTSWLQVDLMAGAYGGAYGGRQASTDLLARHRDDDEVSLDGFNIVRKALPGGDSDGDDDDPGAHPLFGSFSRRLEPGSWAVVCQALGMQVTAPGEAGGEGKGEASGCGVAAGPVAAPAVFSGPAWPGRPLDGKLGAVVSESPSLAAAAPAGVRYGDGTTAMAAATRPVEVQNTQPRLDLLTEVTERQASGGIGVSDCVGGAWTAGKGLTGRGVGVVQGASARLAGVGGCTATPVPTPAPAPAAATLLDEPLAGSSAAMVLEVGDVMPPPAPSAVTVEVSDVAPGSEWTMGRSGGSGVGAREGSSGGASHAASSGPGRTDRCSGGAVGCQGSAWELG